MSEWIVYGKDGRTEKCRLKSVEYNGSFLNERAVSATIENHSKIQFEVFDYIEYRGERFELESIPTVKKTSSFSYEYELRFVSYKYELERCEMRDIVPNDNRVVYPTPLTFSFTGDVKYLVERIQACLDDLYGKGVWNLSVADDVVSEEKNITVAQQNCWNALSLVNTTYGLNFYIKGRNITIGGSQPILNHTFQYGKGNGLYEIERTSDTDTAIVTKLRAYGSERNLDYSYPKKPEWSDSLLDTSFVLSPLRLMLPSFKKDGKTDYILADEATIAEYGIREASVIYDDIYPTITGAKNLQGQAIDEIKAVEAVDDTKSIFVIHLHDLGFDLESQLTTANAQISMKSGAMQGYTFNIAENGIEKQSDNSYKITLGRITTDTSDTGNYDIPNSSWNMAAGDKFVLLNILMPQEYIREAENRLLERAKEYLAEYGKTNFSYNVGLHDKFLVENSDVYSSLVEGAKLTIHDAVLGISEDVTIQSITITENAEDNILPQVKITLNNKPSASTLDRIQGQIKELSETTSGTFSSQSELLKQYRKKLDKPFFDRLFVAVGLDGKELASTDTNSPIAYIKAKYSFATIGGVTMYAQDGNIDIPTIAEGLPFDNRTIWFNPETNQIEVIGGTGGGATTLGSLSNVGSWADSVAPQDRIMYQAANSSQWVAKNLSDLAVGGVTGNYLPLSGGTLTNTLTIDNSTVGLILHRSGQKTPYIRFGQDANNEWGELGVYNDGRLVFWPLVSSQGGYNQWNTVWHAGNDGSGSGLDADLLDGLHLWDGQWNSIPRIGSDGVMEIGKYIDFHHATSIVDYSVRIISPNIEGVSITLPSSSGTLALTSSNVASATRIQAYTHDSGEKIIISGSRSDNTYPRKIYDNGWALQVSWQDANGVVHNGNIASLNDNVASATKLATARTIWGQSFNGTGNVDGTFTVTSNENLPIRIHSYYSSSWVSAILATNTSLVAGQHFNINVGYGDSAYNNAWIGYYHAGVGSTSNRLSMGLHSVDDVINILGTGNVGVGTTNPSAKLHVAGDILATGGITMYSARKLKTIQDERGLSLEELSIIKPTRFTWKDGRDNKVHIGGIADDVQKVLPEVIYKADNDTLTMDYGNAAFAIAASLIKPVVNHEERIRLLEDENKRLKEEVEQLKWNIA